MDIEPAHLYTLACRKLERDVLGGIMLFLTGLWLGLPRESEWKDRLGAIVFAGWFLTGILYGWHGGAYTTGEFAGG